MTEAAEKPVREPDVERLRARYGRRFEAGEVIFREGDPGTTVFLLEEGCVRLTKTVRGTPRNLMVLKPGDLFGESAMRGEPVRTSAAVAVTSGLALALERATVQHLVEHSPAVAARLVGQLLRRLRDAEDRIEVMWLDAPQAKVVCALLRLAQRARPEVGPGAVSLALTPMELATTTALDVDAVKRVVQRLRERGYVRVADERLEVLDLAALLELFHLLEIEDDIRGPRFG